MEDAEEMADVLGDERLFAFTGGRPAAPDELRARYQRLVAGPWRFTKCAERMPNPGWL